MIGGVCINIYNISGLPPLARSCYTEAAAAVQSAVSADGPGRPCCPGEVIHDLEQVVPRARTASMDYSRLFDEETWRPRGPVLVLDCCFQNKTIKKYSQQVRSRFLPSRRWRPQSASPGRTVTSLTADRFTSRPIHVFAVVQVLLLVGRGGAPTSSTIRPRRRCCCGCGSSSVRGGGGPLRDGVVDGVVLFPATFRRRA